MKYLKKTGYIVSLLVFLFLVLGPFIWTFVISVTPEYAMFAKTTDLLPEVVTFDNYMEIFSGGRRGGLILTGIVNSLKAVATTLIVGIPVCMLSAYALNIQTGIPTINVVATAFSELTIPVRISPPLLPPLKISI